LNAKYSLTKIAKALKHDKRTIKNIMKREDKEKKPRNIPQHVINMILSFEKKK